VNFVAIISWLVMETCTHNRSASVKAFRDEPSVAEADKGLHATNSLARENVPE
jgi:hypothetical protein